MPETKTQRLHSGLAREIHKRLEEEFAPLRIPEGWHDIWRERDRRDSRSQRVTMLLDADVIRFFKSMGAGYQPRINRVLRAFMHDRLAGVVAGPEHRITSEDIAELRDILDELEAEE